MRQHARVSAVVAAVIVAISASSALIARGGQPPYGSLPTGRVLFEDDIRSTTWNPISDETCNGRQGDGGYIVRGMASNNTCRIYVSFAGVFSGDLRIEMTLRQRQGAPDASFGVIFAAQDNSFSKFAISSNGYYVLNTIANSVWSNMVNWTQSPAIRQGAGASNRLAIEIRGRRIQVFANGQLLNSATSSMDIRGKIGFYVNDLNQDVVFSDVRVSDISSGSAPPSPPTTPRTTMTAGGRVVAEDDMATTPRYGIGRSADCIQEYGEGGYVVESPATGKGCVVFLFNAGDHPVHLRYEVSARVVRGGDQGYGMMFGRSGSEVYVYAVTHGPIIGKIELGRTSGQYTALIPTFYNANVRGAAGASNRLAVEINGRDVRLFMNGAFVQAITTPTSPQGQAGIGAVNGARVVFNNFKVIDFVAPQMSGGPLRRAGEGVAAVEATILRGAAESMASLGATPQGPGPRAESASGASARDVRR